MSNKLTECPDCKGSGEIIGLFPVWAENVPKKDRKPVIALDCPRCEGKKKIPEEMLEWIGKGKVLKEKRRNKHLTLRKAARMLHIELLMLYAMENGHVEPSMKIGYDLPIRAGKK